MRRLEREVADLPAVGSVAGESGIDVSEIRLR